MVIIIGRETSREGRVHGGHVNSQDPRIDQGRVQHRSRTVARHIGEERHQLCTTEIVLPLAGELAAGRQGVGGFQLGQEVLAEVVPLGHVGLHAVLGREEFVTGGDRATVFPSAHVLQVLLGVDVETAPGGEPGTAAFHGAHERLRAQVGDAVAFQVFGPGEGLATALHGTGEPAVVLVLPLVS